jgi:hypothetical protein
MPRGLHIEIEAVGIEKAQRAFAGIGRRLLDMRPAWRNVERVLEEGESRHFDRQRGRYVRTGDLRASLTHNVDGAIREAHANELVFGTSLYYAKFQRRGKKSAVVVLHPLMRRQAADAVMEHILGEDEGT